jgi:hypothetical protein
MGQILEHETLGTLEKTLKNFQTIFEQKSSNSYTKSRSHKDIKFDSAMIKHFYIAKNKKAP